MKPRRPMRADILARVLADMDGDLHDFEVYRDRADQLIAAYMAEFFLRRSSLREGGGGGVMKHGSAG